VRIVALGVALVALTPSRRAEACGCSLDNVVIPAADAVHVPLDTRVMYRENYHVTGPGLISLRSPDGPVAVIEEPNNGELLTPVAPLAPNTTYEILFDDEVVSRFTTGETLVEGVPAAPDIIQFSAYREENDPSNTCGEAIFDRSVLGLTPDPSVAFYFVGRPDSTYVLTPEALYAATGSAGATCWEQDPAFGKGQNMKCMGLRAAYLDGSSSAYVEVCDENEYRPFDPPVEPEPPVDPEKPDEAGCSVASGGEAGAWLLLVGLLALRRRRAGAA
jgi:MYXO-CTERM domain-containing protein